MQTSDVIALLAAGVAGLAALYARHTATHDRRANQIIIQNALRPDRLAVYSTLVEFMDFCSTYRTLQSVGKVNGTGDLVARLDRFKWEIAQRGPLDMSRVEALIQETNTKTWQLQRILDRLGGPSAKPVDSACETADDNLDGLNDWFGTQKKGATALFDPYLKIAQQVRAG